MNPLEAMARAIFEKRNPDKTWDDATTAERIISYSCARAAKDALADNVSEAMRNALEDRRHDLAAAIRAAGEE